LPPRSIPWQAAYDTTRPGLVSDPGSAALSYWTDNGGYYDGDYWNQPVVANQTAPAAAVMRQLLATWGADTGLPFASAQLDPYWYMHT